MRSHSVRPLVSVLRRPAKAAALAGALLVTTVALPLSTVSASSAQNALRPTAGGPSRLPTTAISSASALHSIMVKNATHLRLSVAKQAKNITDPTLLDQSLSNWNSTGGAFYLNKAALNDTSQSPFRQFHSANYAPNLLTKGECGDNSKGKPNPATCSGVGADELSPIGTNDTVQLELYGALFTKVGAAHKWLMDSHNFILSQIKGEKATPCKFTDTTLPNCYIFGFAFTNSSNKVVDYGYYVELQVQNILGEGLDFISPKDESNKNKLGAFGSDLFNLLAYENAVFTTNTTDSSNKRVLATDPLASLVPFDVWPSSDLQTALGPVQPSDADNSALNPMGQFHVKNKKVVTYTSSGMISNGSCGVDSNNKPLPKKCGGFIEISDSPFNVNKTFQTIYLGTVYKKPAKATAQLTNSIAAKGTACPFVDSNNNPIPGCDYVILAATGKNNAKLDLLYGITHVQNGLAEVMVVVNASDFKSKTTGPVIANSFFNVLFGGYNAAYSAANPSPPPSKMAKLGNLAGISRHTTGSIHLSR